MGCFLTVSKFLFVFDLNLGMYLLLDKGRRTSEDNVLEERDPKYDTMLNQMVGRIKAKPGGKAEMGEVCSVVSLSFVYLLFDLMH